MKAVVDTNVLVAGLLSPFGPPGEIVRMIASGALRVASMPESSRNMARFSPDQNFNSAPN